jgi:hypothetical protein
VHSSYKAGAEWKEYSDREGQRRSGVELVVLLVAVPDDIQILPFWAILFVM